MLFPCLAGPSEGWDIYLLLLLLVARIGSLSAAVKTSDGEGKIYLVVDCQTNVNNVGDLCIST